MHQTHFTAIRSRVNRSLLFTVMFLVVFCPLVANASNDTWQYLKEDEGVSLYRADSLIEGYLPFKAVATVDATAEQVVMAMVDAERKSHWAPKLKSSTVHSQISSNQFEFSEYYTTPWPFWDREFLLVGTVNYYDDRVVFSANNSKQIKHADPDHVLVDVAVLDFEITPLGENRSRVTFTFSGEFGGWIPPFVKTIIQEKWPVRFIQALQLRVQQGQSLATPRYHGLIKNVHEGSTLKLPLG